MNDFNNYNITRPKNVEELFKIILEIITRLYEKHIPDEVKHRKNKKLAKMSDVEIITIQILIECLGKTQNSGYQYLQANYPNLVNYVERSRFNRLVKALFTVIKCIRQKINRKKIVNIKL